MTIRQLRNLLRFMERFSKKFVSECNISSLEEPLGWDNGWTSWVHVEKWNWVDKSSGISNKKNLRSAQRIFSGDSTRPFVHGTKVVFFGKWQFFYILKKKKILIFSSLIKH